MPDAPRRPFPICATRSLQNIRNDDKSYFISVLERDDLQRALRELFVYRRTILLLPFM